MHKIIQKITKKRCVMMMPHWPYYHPYEVHYHRNDQPYYHPPHAAYDFQQTPYSGPQPQQPQTPYEQFEKPPLPAYWENEMQHQPEPHPQGKPVPNFMSNFQNENGQLDVDKMLNTVGQMANTYHQVYPIFKQFGSFIKNFNR